MDILQVSIFLTVFRIQLFKQTTQISHSRSYLLKKEVSVHGILFDNVCLCSND